MNSDNATANDQWPEDGDHPDLDCVPGIVDDESGFAVASFPVELSFSCGDESLLPQASRSVRQEYQDSARWQRLTCQSVSVYAERDRGVIYAVQTLTAVDFDWRWEGAVAFLPETLRRHPDASDHELRNLPYDDPQVWSGEIIEVDSARGCLYVSLDDPERIPQTGVFLVRPFEFLRTLNSVYNEPAFEEVRRVLPGRLVATLGGVHPRIAARSGPKIEAALPELRQWWDFGWSILWGPPGTGKTYTAGQQIAAALNDPNERILVISTTNRATDAIAVSIGMAAKSSHGDLLSSGQLLRIGKGADWSEFDSRGVESMLQNTEADLLVQVDDLAKQLASADASDDKAGLRNQIASLQRRAGDRSRRIVLDPAVRVVVCTAFRAMSVLDLNEVRQQIESDFAPFTTVMIDEGGLVSRAAVAALSMLASRRVVLVGDSRQLAPISRISRILPQRYQVWLAGSALGHLREFESETTAVHMLKVQRRMHPDL
ncbi:MAG: AAA family ATPase, partial [Planctomycetaceae bacterium]|nr:AAA family ATPase [Planctomycetaceae bacterium]